jgi:threonyl-tRNA synthetase
VWQCGTIQVDFSTPGRLSAEYVDSEGEKQTPVMLHRAIFGSIERFMGILLEHYEGKLPVWLMPDQVVVMTIADRHADYASQLVDQLKKEGFRAMIDLRNEKIGFKIREHTIARVPFQLIIGDRELAETSVSLRSGSGETESLSLAALLDRLAVHRLPSFY